MQNTQFINSAGQAGVRATNDITLTADSALPGMITFTAAYTAGLIEDDKPFVVRVELDDDNWYLAKFSISGSPATTLEYVDAEEDPHGTVPDTSVVEVTAVLSAEQLIDAFNDPSAQTDSGADVYLPYTGPA